MMLRAWNEKRDGALRRVGRFGPRSRHVELERDLAKEEGRPRVSFGARSRRRRGGAPAQIRFWTMVAILAGVLAFMFG